MLSTRHDAALTIGLTMALSMSMARLGTANKQLRFLSGRCESAATKCAELVSVMKCNNDTRNQRNQFIQTKKPIVQCN